MFGGLVLVGILLDVLLKAKVNDNHNYSERILRNFVVSEQQQIKT